MVLNALPIVGWFLSTFCAISMAIPFWFCWSYCGLGTHYFYFLPPVYQSISFWNVVGLFIIIWTLRSLLPKFASIENKAELKE